VAAKQYLYVHGIGGVVDSGKWENPPPDDQVIGFEHVFLWRDATNSIVGKMWASRDGKNRTKYPMIVTVHLSNRSVPGMPDIMPILEELETGCKKTNSAEEVQALIAASRGRAAGLLDAPAVTPINRAQFAEEIGLTRESDATLRVVYAAESYLGWMRSGPTAAIDLKLSDSKMQPQHIRVPSNKEKPLASILFWQSYFQTLLPDSVPQFYLAALDAPWLDLIAGPLTPRHLPCIRSGGKAMPPANSIPFELSEADRETARKKWAAFLES
jgi:hypothetical protein